MLGHCFVGNCYCNLLITGISEKFCLFVFGFISCVLMPNNLESLVYVTHCFVPSSVFEINASSWKKKEKPLLVVCSKFLFHYNFVFTRLIDILILYLLRDFLGFENLVLLCNCKWNKLFINSLGLSWGKSFLC